MIYKVLLSTFLKDIGFSTDRELTVQVNNICDEYINANKIQFKDIYERAKFKRGFWIGFMICEKTRKNRGQMITENQRIEFIRLIEGFEKINAYLDLEKISDIKKKLRDAGLYRNELREIKDSSIVNLLLKAQGKKPTRIMKTKTSKKDSRRKMIDL